jgi:hypothetical protein
MRKPNLDYYMARPVEAVISGEQEWDWSIRLEGGALINNKDRRRKAEPTIPEGASLLSVDTSSPTATVVQFGTSSGAGVNVMAEISLTPHLFTVADPDYTGGDEIYPGMEEDEEDTLPPDPSPLRVVDGPEKQAVEAPEEAQEVTE